MVVLLCSNGDVIKTSITVMVVIFEIEFLVHLSNKLKLKNNYIRCRCKKNIKLSLFSAILKKIFLTSPKSIDRSG